jgi:hypothetical protein
LGKEWLEVETPSLEDKNQKPLKELFGITAIMNLFKRKKGNFMSDPEGPNYELERKVPLEEPTEESK